LPLVPRARANNLVVDRHHHCGDNPAEYDAPNYSRDKPTQHKKNNECRSGSYAKRDEVKRHVSRASYCQEDTSATRSVESPLIATLSLNQGCLRASQIHSHNFGLTGKD